LREHPRIELCVRRRDELLAKLGLEAG
jgi:hypothetical protein